MNNGNALTWLALVHFGLFINSSTNFGQEQTAWCGKEPIQPKNVTPSVFCCLRSGPNEVNYRCESTPSLRQHSDQMRWTGKMCSGSSGLCHSVRNEKNTAGHAEKSQNQLSFWRNSKKKVWRHAAIAGHRPKSHLLDRGKIRELVATIMCWLRACVSLYMAGFGLDVVCVHTGCFLCNRLIYCLNDCLPFAAHHWETQGFTLQLSH